MKLKDRDFYMGKMAIITDQEFMEPPLMTFIYQLEAQTRRQRPRKRVW